MTTAPDTPTWTSPTDIAHGSQPITVRLTPPVLTMVGVALTAIISTAVYLKTLGSDVSRLREDVAEMRHDMDSAASRLSRLGWQMEWHQAHHTPR